MVWLIPLILASPSGREECLINLAPNPSFEEGEGSRPAGWEGIGEAGRARLVWEAGCARSGERSLRIDRGTGPAWWEGVRIPVRPTDVVRAGAMARREEAAGAARIALAWVQGEREIGVTLGPPAEAKEGDEEAESEWASAIAAGPPPEGADGVRVRLAAEAGRGAVWFDDVFVGIDNPEIEVFGSHLGFHPVGLKEFIVRSRLPLIDAYAILAGTPDGSEPIRKGLEVHPVPQRTGGYFHGVVEFTDFRRPGSYGVQIRAGLPEGYPKERERKAPIPTFRISDRIYRDLAGLASRWFAIARCGIGVEGWHGPCHLDDGVLRRPDGSIEGFVEATGGWHDGADYTKDVDRTWPGVLALAELERLGARWQEPRGRSLREAAWGAGFLLAMARPDGSFHARVEGTKPFAGPPEAETDNRPRTGDERTVLAEGKVPPAILAARAAWGLAAFSGAPGHAEPELRGRALRAAREGLAFALRPPLPKGRELDFWGAVLAATCALWRATGDPEDQDIADDAIQPILRLQHPEGWFRAGEGGEEVAPDPENGLLYVVALAEYAVLLPDGSFAGPARDALERYFSFADRALNATPFGVPAEYGGPEDRPAIRRFPRGTSAYFGAAAYAAFRAAEATRNPRFIFVGERILQWLLGGNPLDRCLIVGAGGREPGPQATTRASIPGRGDGRIPGGVIGGIEGPYSYGAAAQAWLVASLAELERALRERARILDEVEERWRKRREERR